jgi:hypothetical protein
MESGPYFAVTVSDLLSRTHVERGEAAALTSQGLDNASPKQKWSTDSQGRDEVGGGRDGRLEVWGLTGWYLNVFLRALRIYA